jgi:hypothetical protein
VNQSHIQQPINRIELLLREARNNFRRSQQYDFTGSREKSDQARHTISHKLTKIDQSPGLSHWCYRGPHGQGKGKMLPGLFKAAEKKKRGDVRRGLGHCGWPGGGGACGELRREGEGKRWPSVITGRESGSVRRSEGLRK